MYLNNDSAKYWRVPNLGLMDNLYPKCPAGLFVNVIVVINCYWELGKLFRQ